MRDRSISLTHTPARSPRRRWGNFVVRGACLAFFGVGMAGAAIAADDKTTATPATHPATPPARAGRGEKMEPVKISGTLEYFNLGRDGLPESMMLKSGDDLVQLDFPPGAADAVGNAAKEGAKIEATAMPAPGGHEGHDGHAGQGAHDGQKHDGAHRILRLVGLSGPDGKSIDLTPGKEPAPTKVEGTIKHLNYARDGHLDGVVLGDGEFVQFGPEVANVLKLAAGQKLVAEGHARALPGNHTAIEADVINGMAVAHGQSRMQPRQGQSGMPDGRGSRAAGGPRGFGPGEMNGRQHGPQGGRGMMPPRRFQGDREGGREGGGEGRGEGNFRPAPHGPQGERWMGRMPQFDRRGGGNGGGEGQGPVRGDFGRRGSMQESRQSHTDDGMRGPIRGGRGMNQRDGQRDGQQGDRQDHFGPGRDAERGNEFRGGPRGFGGAGRPGMNRDGGPPAQGGFGGGFGGPGMEGGRGPRQGPGQRPDGEANHAGGRGPRGEGRTDPGSHGPGGRGGRGGAGGGPDGGPQGDSGHDGSPRPPAGGHPAKPE